MLESLLPTKPVFNGHPSRGAMRGRSSNAHPPHGFARRCACVLPAAPCGESRARLRLFRGYSAEARELAVSGATPVGD
jgi:hypothetical protein